METRPNRHCFLRRIPKPVLFLAAWLSIGAGFPLFLTPLPGGVVLIGLGLFLFSCASPGLRAGIDRRLGRLPWLARHVGPLLARFDACSREASGRHGVEVESSKLKAQSSKLKAES